MSTAGDLTEWCRRLKASDREAYAQVFEALYTPLFRYVCSITNDESTARDLTQDVFVRLWDVRESLDPGQSLRAYLYRVARNRAYNYRRNERTHDQKEEDVRRRTNARPTEPPSPDVATEGAQLEARLRTWIADLPERQREALVLSRFEGLSHDEIAEVMDISPRTVNNHIVRALKHLRNHVRDYEPELIDRYES